MTRLTNSDIRDISARLSAYDAELKVATGAAMLGIAAHARGMDETTLSERLRALTVRVIPVSGGQGIITDFSRTVAAILNFLGCDARVAEHPDVWGLASAYDAGADAVFMADDHRFVGIHLNTRVVADNSEATGRVFAAALDLMAGGIKNRSALVLGCGPVGEAGARALAGAGAKNMLYDTNPEASQALKALLDREYAGASVQVLTALPEGPQEASYILEATPSGQSIPDGLATAGVYVAAPGVPLGISSHAADRMGPRLVHDKLELGVAAMAADLVADKP